jgi:hypothetical protein
VTEKRRHPRLELEADITVRTEYNMFPGRAREIGESGLSAILPVELRIGEQVELQIKLVDTTVMTRAVVRHRNVFRHGFEFVQPLHNIVRNDALAGDCQRCDGTGSIIQPLVRNEGVAFATNRCSECGGTGHMMKQGG